MREDGDENKRDEGHDHGESAEGEELARRSLIHSVLVVRSVERIPHPRIHVHLDLIT